MYGSSSLLWCQVRWEHGAEPKGIRALWCKGEGAAGRGLPDEDGHEDNGKGGVTHVLQPMRVYVQSTLLPILSWPSFTCTHGFRESKRHGDDVPTAAMPGHLL